ncbi:MAG TPA: porin [Pontibacter sp.]
MNTFSRFCSVFLLASAAILSSVNESEAQTENKTKLGKGVQFVAADSSFSLKVSPFFQVLYQGGNNPATETWDDRFLIRRLRLKLEGFAYSPKLEYKIALGFSNSDMGGEPRAENNFGSNIVLDAFIKWEMAQGLSLMVGQAKLPGNRERLVSSQKMQFVDRSLLNSRFNLDRDAGLQLQYEHQLGTVIFRETASIATGDGRGNTTNHRGGYDYTGRFEVLPFGAFEGGGEYSGGDLVREQTPKLALAAAFDYNDGATRERGQNGDNLSQQRDLRTLFIDAMFKYRGFSAMGEYVHKRAEGSPVVLVDEAGDVEETFVTGNAFNVQAGYLLPANWEIAGRYTTYNPTAVTQITPEKQYTLGLSKYIVGHNLKVQSDLTLQDRPGRTETYQFRVQLQVGI